MFHKLKEHLAPDTPGFRVLCPTRWTVRASSLQPRVIGRELVDYLLCGMKFGFRIGFESCYLKRIEEHEISSRQSRTSTQVSA